MAVAVLLFGVTFAIHEHGVHKLAARLVSTTPDTVPDHPELLAYALPLGKAAYAENCASCHGADMKGDPMKGVPDLTDNDFLYGTGRVSDIERVIMYGIRAGNSKGWDLAFMPAFARENPYPRYKIGSLTEQDLWDVVAYLRSFQNPPDDLDAVKRGEKLFHSYKKGTCWDCHATDAMGDSGIGAPNLTDTVWLYGDGSPKWIYDAIAFGLDGYCPPFINRMSDVDMRATAVYLHSILKLPAKGPMQAASAGPTPK